MDMVVFMLKVILKIYIFMSVLYQHVQTSLITMTLTCFFWKQNVVSTRMKIDQSYNVFVVMNFTRILGNVIKNIWYGIAF